MAALGSLLRLLSGAALQNERLRVFAVVAKIRLGARSTCHKARTRRRDFKLRGELPAPWHPAAGRFDPLEKLPKSGESTVVSYVRGQPFDPGARANACAARCLRLGFVP